MKLVDYLLDVKLIPLIHLIYGIYNTFASENFLFFQTEALFQNRYPEYISRVKKSSSVISTELVDYHGNSREEYIRDMIQNGLGIEDDEDFIVKYLNLDLAYITNLLTKYVLNIFNIIFFY